MSEKVDMRRAAACVNACAGISTEALESGALAELVGAAETFIDTESPTDPMRVYAFVSHVRVVLHKLKGSP